MSREETIEVIKFVLTHFDDYLDVSIGMDRKSYSDELVEFKKSLKNNRKDFNEEERVEHDTILFLKYLEFEGIELIKDENIK